MWKLLTYKHKTNNNIQIIVSLDSKHVRINEFRTIFDAIGLLSKKSYPLLYSVSTISPHYYSMDYTLESTIEFNEQTHPEYFI